MSATAPIRIPTSMNVVFDAQVRAFDNCQGFFFWSYKIESGDPAWSLRDAAEKGLKLGLQTGNTP